MNKRYQEPRFECKDKDFQLKVEKSILKTHCINCGKPFDNTKIMWIDLSDGEIVWWHMKHTQMFGELHDYDNVCNRKPVVLSEHFGE